jgi:hypothetical protein
LSWPTITYGKGFRDDGYTLTPEYTWTENGTVAGDLATMLPIYGDYFDLDLTAIGGDASVWWEYPDSGGANNISISTNTYPKVHYRYKCSNATVKAKIVSVNNDATTDTWLAATNNETWTYGTATLTDAKTLDHIRLYAETAIGHVYYDFADVFQGIFTFPSANLVELIGPSPRVPYLPIPCKDGVDPQNLGSDPIQVRINADMDVDDTTWNSGKVFDQISHDLSFDLWQWLTLPEHDRQFKVTMAEPYRMPFENGQLSLELLLKEYKLADARALENYVERFGH